MQILVLGMHRSGTSAVSRILNLAGAYFGPEGVSTGFSKENPKGFWERRDVRELNDLLLQANGGDWDRPLMYEAEALPEDKLLSFKKRAMTLIHALEAHRPWFIKEPRLCLTASRWLPLLESPVGLIVYRNPKATAQSLHKRNQIPIDAGMAMWLMYYRELEQATRNVPLVFVEYEQVLSDPYGTFKSLIGQLNEHGTSKLRIPEEEELTAFINPSLNHSKDCETELPDCVNKMYESLKQGKLSPGIELAEELKEALISYGRDSLVTSNQSKLLGMQRDLLKNFANLDNRLSDDRFTELKTLLVGLQDEKRNLVRQNSQLRDVNSELRQQIKKLEKEQHIDTKREEILSALQATQKAATEQIKELLSQTEMDLGIDENSDLQQAVKVLCAFFLSQHENFTELKSRHEKAEKESSAATHAEQELLQLRSRFYQQQETLEQALAEWSRINREAIREKAESHQRSLDWKTEIKQIEARVLALSDNLLKQMELAQKHDMRALNKDKTLQTASQLLRLSRRPFYKSGVKKARNDAKIWLKKNAEYLDNINNTLRQGERKNEKYQHQLNAMRAELETFSKRIKALRQSICSESDFRNELKKVKAPSAIAVKEKATVLQTKKSMPGTERPLLGENKSRVAVYTANIGGYDQLKNPLYVNDRFDFYAFTDQPVAKDSVWVPLDFDYHNDDPTRTARFVKTHPHLYFADYDWSIWVDANLLIRGDLVGLIERVAANADKAVPIGLYRHPHRNDIYEEYEEICTRGGLDDEAIIKHHIERYRKENFPGGTGLGETNVLVRKHNDPQVLRYMNAWWREIDNGSKRDQLSFNYVGYRLSLPPIYLGPKGLSVRNDERFSRFAHQKKPRTKG